MTPTPPTPSGSSEEREALAKIIDPSAFRADVDDDDVIDEVRLVRSRARIYSERALAAGFTRANGETVDKGRLVQRINNLERGQATLIRERDDARREIVNQMVLADAAIARAEAAEAKLDLIATGCQRHPGTALHPCGICGSPQCCAKCCEDAMELHRLYERAEAAEAKLAKAEKERDDCGDMVAHMNTALLAAESCAAALAEALRDSASMPDAKDGDGWIACSERQPPGLPEPAVDVPSQWSDMCESLGARAVTAAEIDETFSDISDSVVARAWGATSTGRPIRPAAPVGAVDSTGHCNSMVHWNGGLMPATPPAAPTPAVTDADKLRTLLRRYVGHVRICEGIDFIDHEGYNSEWSAEDRAAITAALAAGRTDYVG